MEVIRKKICLDDFRSHICGALNCVSGTANNVNSGNDILFDDENRHLEKWTGTAIHAENMIESLKALAA